jgi:transcriptional regulator with XRE-family HTH domain
MQNFGLKELRQLGHISLEEFARECGVTPRTVQLWESGKLKTPRYAVKVAHIKAGFLPGEDWKGWRFIKGKLYAPEGYGYGPGDIRSIYWLRQANETMRQELAKLRPPPEPVQLPLPLPHIPVYDRRRPRK